MDPIIEWRDVSFRYQQQSLPSLSHVSLAVEPGEFVLLTGPTGCGKSTLLKTLNGLIPQEARGDFFGTILVAGENTKTQSIAHFSQWVGMVFQSPDDQIFSTTVFDETAFILENMGFDDQEIHSRVTETLQLVGLSEKQNDSIYALSGGQKQRLAVAAVLAARPRILALDEPISQLDPQGAAELLTLLEKLNQLGTTILLVEHRLHEVMPLCRRVVLMKEGKMIWQGSREDAYRNAEFFHSQGLRLPQTVDICFYLGADSRSATVADTVAAIQQKYQVPLWRTKDLTETEKSRKLAAEVAAALEIHQLSFQYEKQGPFILQHLNLTVPQGQFVALMGTNGAGKSTLLEQIAGLLTPGSGFIEVMGKRCRGMNRQVGLVLQNPDLMLFNSSVADEIEFSRHALGQEAVASNLEDYLMATLKLSGLEKKFPLALSRGQRLRVAIAAVLAVKPSLLLLDEPTTGQDIGRIEDIIRLLKAYTQKGGTVLFCTHDTEVAARFADRIIVLGQGKVVLDDVPKVVFSQSALLHKNGLKPPLAMITAQQLYRGLAVSVEEVVHYVRQESMGSRTGSYSAS